MPTLRDLLASGRPLTVGALTDPGVLGEQFTAADCDLIELRLDALGTGDAVRSFAERHFGTLPLLMTARSPAEGGLNEWEASTRAEALATFLPLAGAIDIELASLRELRPVWEEAGAAGVVRVVSGHNFQGLPEDTEIMRTLDAMARTDADIAKVAFALGDEDDLFRFATVVRSWGTLPLAYMGMGDLGPASRVLAVLGGSVFNYGFLGGEATAPGQWPARLLKEVIDCSPTGQG